MSRREEIDVERIKRAGAALAPPSVADNAGEPTTARDEEAACTCPETDPAVRAGTYTVIRGDLEPHAVIRPRWGTPYPAPPPGQADGKRRARWIDSPMLEPWHRDLIAGATAQHSQDLRGWAERIAETYSKSGTLEVTAVVWALLDALDGAES